MKTRIYIAALLAGMLSLAGCGGGSSGISEEDAAARAERAVQDALAGITPCEGDGVMINDDGECVLDPDHMSEADMSAMSKALYAALSLDFNNNDNAMDLDDEIIVNGRFTDATTLQIGESGGTTSDLKKTDASVPALAGWSGAQYTDTGKSDGEINREAHVYTKVMKAKEGNMFGTINANAQVGSVPGAKHQYRLVPLTGDGNWNIDQPAGISLAVSTNQGAIIMIDSFDQDAGYKDYPVPTTGDKLYVDEDGSYHGVRGTFYCGAILPNACRVSHADKGQSFNNNDNWRFVPSDPNARVTMGADDPLASYGWWLDKSGNAWSVGVFDANRGTVVLLSGFALESGSATYRGGAAGKYALTSSTGGRNEAGHFTASVELTAKFGNSLATPSVTDTISGTVSDFKNGQGADIDGEWKVALGESTISNAGVISAKTGGNASDSLTTWSVGETAGTAAGSWSGNMWNLGDDGVPDIVTGTFNAHLGNDGRMAGAFGADHTATP